MKGNIVHGQLQDFIDYQALIENQANMRNTLQVVATRSFKSVDNHSNKKTKNLVKRRGGNT